VDRPQPEKQKYIFQGALESHRPIPAKEIHKPLVLSPEELYRPPMKSQIPSKDDMKMKFSSESLKILSQAPTPTHANNHGEDTDDDIYFDYDPSTYVQKESSNGHAHNDSHEYDYSEQMHATEPLHSHEYDHTPEYHYAPEHDKPHKYPSHDYSGEPLHSHEYDHTPEHHYAPEHDQSHKYPSHDYSGFHLQPPPKELISVMPQPPKDKPAKETKVSLSPPPSKPHEAPPPPSKEPYGAQPPLHIGQMYLPKQTYEKPLHPPKYVYGVHDFEHLYDTPPPLHTTTQPPSTKPPRPPTLKRVAYYHIGRKLYLIPAVFSALFIPYILTYIIRSIIRHKVNVPFEYWQNSRKIDLDENEMERRVARALDAVEKKYK